MSAETACQIMGGTLANPALAGRRWRGVSVDTRTLRRGNAFFCLRGETTDGHRFAPTAAEEGAGAIVAERKAMNRWRPWPLPVIGVDDPLTALGDLAAAYRRGFPTRFVAVTGSVGKTTTKELIATVLSSKYPVFKSPGNYNNLIGIPLALLGRSRRAGGSSDLGVLEFGMSTPGEIARLTEIVSPSWGVVTRIGAAHLMQMKSLAAVARAKRELFDHAQADLVAFLNIDDPYQRRWMAHWDRRTVTYGVVRGGDYSADEITPTSHGVRFRVNGRHRFELPLAGEYNVPNALAAIAVGRHLGIGFAAMVEPLRRVRAAAHRSRIVRLGGVTLIEDCYNANPTSMLAALQSLAGWPGRGRRIAVLGAMRELGEAARQWHRQVGRAAASLDLVVTVGKDAQEYQRGVKTGRAAWTEVRDRSAAITALRRELRVGDVILLKASHTEAFEQIAQALRVHLKGHRTTIAARDRLAKA